MTALFDRFGTDLPPLEGIYLAAFAGGPVTLRDMTDDDVAAMFRPKLDAASLLHPLSLRHLTERPCGTSCCSPRSRACSARDGWPTTPRPAPSSTPSPTHGAPWGCPPPSSTGGCGSRWRTRSTTPGRSASESGLQPMDDEVAIRALPLAMGPDARRGTRSWPPTGRCWPRHIAPAGHCASSTTCCPRRQTVDAAGKRVPQSAARVRTRDRRRDMMLDHVGALASEVMGLPPSEILDPSIGFFQLGMDSLMSVTLQRGVVRQPRRIPDGRGRIRLPDRRRPHRLPGDDPSRIPGMAVAPTSATDDATTTSAKTSCCNNFRRGWADRSD